jgi:multimeric flavodoxin WrbA
MKKGAMKIVGVCGSPRKGNSEWMLTKLCEELSRCGAEVEMLLLRKMDVETCRGCLTCEKGGKKRKGDCVIKDDMLDVYPRLIAADAIILATPGYMEMLSGLLKNFLDRTCAVWPRLEGIGQTILNLKGYAKLCKMRWMGSVAVLAKNPTDAARIPGLENRIKRLARKIISD